MHRTPLVCYTVLASGRRDESSAGASQFSLPFHHPLVLTTDEGAVHTRNHWSWVLYLLNTFTRADEGVFLKQ